MSGYKLPAKWSGEDEAKPSQSFLEKLKAYAKAHNPVPSIDTLAKHGANLTKPGDTGAAYATRVRDDVPQGARQLAATGTRLAAGIPAATIAAVPGLGTVVGAGIGGAGESAAEWVEGSEQNPKRIATEAALAAVPLGKIYKSGQVIKSALRGAALAGVGVEGRKLAEGKNPLDISRGDVLNTALGAGMGAVAAKPSIVTTPISKAREIAGNLFSKKPPVVPEIMPPPTPREEGGVRVWPAPLPKGAKEPIPGVAEKAAAQQDAERAVTPAAKRIVRDQLVKPTKEALKAAGADTRPSTTVPTQPTGISYVYQVPGSAVPDPELAIRDEVNIRSASPEAPSEATTRALTSPTNKKIAQTQLGIERKTANTATRAEDTADLADKRAGGDLSNLTQGARDASNLNARDKFLADQEAATNKETEQVMAQREKDARQDSINENIRQATKKVQGAIESGKLKPKSKAVTETSTAPTLSGKQTLTETWAEPKPKPGDDSAGKWTETGEEGGGGGGADNIDEPPAEEPPAPTPTTPKTPKPKPSGPTKFNQKVEDTLAWAEGQAGKGPVAPPEPPKGPQTIQDLMEASKTPYKAGAAPIRSFAPTPEEEANIQALEEHLDKLHGEGPTPGNGTFHPEEGVPPTTPVEPAGNAPEPSVEPTVEAPPAPAPKARAPKAPKAAVAGPEDQLFQDYLEDARSQGFQGSDEELRGAFDKKLADAKDLMGSEADAMSTGPGGTKVLEAIAKRGGVKADAKGDWQNLWEASSGQKNGNGIVKNGSRVKRGSTVDQGGFKGVKGVLRKNEGLLPDDMAFSLRQEPEFAHIKGPKELQKAIEDAIAEGAGAEPTKLASALEGAGARRGTKWWDEQAPMSVEDFARDLAKEGEKPVAEAPFSLSSEASKAPDAVEQDLLSPQAERAAAPEQAPSGLRVFKSPVDVVGDAYRSAKAEPGINPLAKQQLGTALSAEAAKAGLPTRTPGNLEGFLADKVEPELKAGLRVGVKPPELPESFKPFVQPEPTATPATPPTAAPTAQGGVAQTSKAREAALAKRQAARDAKAAEAKALEEKDVAANQQTAQGLQEDLDKIAQMPPEERQSFLQRLLKGESGQANPALLNALGRMTGGGVFGGLVGLPTGHPFLGAALGAATFGASPYIPMNREKLIDVAQSVRPGANAALNFANRFHNTALLSPLSVAKKAGGDIGGIVSAGLENPERSGDLVKTLLSPQAWKDAFGAGMEAQRTPFGIEQMSGLENTAFNNPIARNTVGLAGRTMSGLTAGTKSLLGSAGFSPEEQAYYTMTNQPFNKAAKAVLRETQTQPAIQHVAPFMRIGMNRFGRGFERSPLGLLNLLKDPTSRDATAKILMRAGLGTAAIGAAYYMTPEDFVKEHPVEASLIASLGGPFGIPIMAGMAAATSKEGSSYPDVANALSKDVPGLRFIEDVAHGQPGEIMSNYLSGYTNFMRPLATGGEALGLLPETKPDVDTRHPDVSVLDRAKANIPFVREGMSEALPRNLRPKSYNGFKLPKKWE